jgi:type II secretory ATPase GspE/PulE/Tfp pilus assembly ATPase PilB-like protein
MQIVDILKQKGLLSKDQIKIIKIQQQQSLRNFLSLAIDMGFVAEKDLQDVIEEIYHKQYIDIENLTVTEDIKKILDKSFVLKFRVVPISYEQKSKTLGVLVDNVYIDDAIDIIKNNNKEIKDVTINMCTNLELSDVIDRVYGYKFDFSSLLDKSFNSSDATTDQCVYSLLQDAIRHTASDIHLEPEKDFVRIRYRIDGILQNILCFHRHFYQELCGRIKIMAQMDIVLVNYPQDGSFSLNFAGKNVDFRVATMPVLFGENINIRILNRNVGLLSFIQLGLSTAAIDDINKMIAKPYGVILVVGPTGCGKTTTLNAILNSLNNSSVNIMTLEDPVEYPMIGVRQTSINTKIDYAAGIRAILRQDPDIIMVGEIRDENTAQMLINASNTGHQVFSTLHANSVTQTFMRLKNLNVSVHNIANSINGIISQRLVRKLCKYCKKQVNNNIFKPVGCKLCSYSGYKGRLLITSTLCVDETIVRLLEKETSQTDLLEHLKNKKTLEGEIRTIIEQGLTSTYEAKRVLNYDF